MATTKQCRQCNQEFEITAEDLEFYKKISPTFAGKTFEIPAPSLCYECRLQRRLMRRNERALYSGECALCHKKIISAYAPNSGITSYCNICWYGDGWEPLDYGKKYDENWSFLEQFNELYRSVPQIALQNDNGITSVNCEYCQDNALSKNCYLVSGCWHVEDSMYSHETDYSKNMIDCDMVTHSEICYECTNSTNLYNCFYVENSENCHDCLMSYDLIGCNNCIECCSLRNKSDHIRNKPATKEEIAQKRKEILNSRQSIREAREEFDKWSLDFPRKFANIVKCDNCVGNTLRNCKNTYGFSTYNAIDCRYFNNGDSPITCYDVFQSGKPELCYEGITPDESYLTHFTAWCWRCRNVLYSDNCISLQDSIGCTGFKRGQYCILNKQYSKEEYEKIAAEIIEKLIADNEWGEYFPMSISPFGYNEAMSKDFFPLEKEAAVKLGAKWQDNDYINFEGEAYEPKQTIGEYRHSESEREKLLTGVLRCRTSGKPFKIMPQELAFYIEHGIPIPKQRYDVRFEDRLARRYFLKLFHRQCMCDQKDHGHEGHCKNEFETTYAPDRPEKVYCEDCYQESVI